MKSNISIIQANLDDLFIIHQMQIISFRSLLDKYQDYDNSPGAENIEKITMRFNQPNTTYYLIQNNKISIGAIRIVSLENGQIYRISPIFIIPEYQNKNDAAELIKSNKIDAEIRYNKKNIFSVVRNAYFILGCLLFLVSFINMFVEKKWISKVSYVLLVGIIISFTYHMYGIGMRWYISGYAPWSNSPW